MCVYYLTKVHNLFYIMILFSIKLFGPMNGGEWDFLSSLVLHLKEHVTIFAMDFELVYLKSLIKVHIF